MFREIRTAERISERTREEYDFDERIRVSVNQEFEESKKFWNNMFNSIDVDKRL